MPLAYLLDESIGPATSTTSFAASFRRQRCSWKRPCVIPWRWPSPATSLKAPSTSWDIPRLLVPPVAHDSVWTSRRLSHGRHVAVNGFVDGQDQHSLVSETAPV
jgi:hypothetical protein